MDSFFAETFFALFLTEQKRSLTDFRKKNDKNVGLFFIFGSFVYKGEKYLLILVLTFKFTRHT